MSDDSKVYGDKAIEISSLYSDHIRTFNMMTMKTTLTTSDGWTPMPKKRSQLRLPVPPS